MEKEDLLLYFLEKEGLKNPTDFFEVEKYKQLVFKKMEDETSEYFKINKLYKELDKIHKENKSNLKEYYDLLKEIKTYIEDDIDIEKELIFVEEFEDLSKEDEEIDFSKNINLVLKNIMGKELNFKMDDLSTLDVFKGVFNDRNVKEDAQNTIKKMFLDSFGDKYLGKGYSKLIDFKINLFEKCKKDRRLFDENGNQIESFSVYFIGRMYLKAALIVHELSVFNEVSPKYSRIENENSLKEVSDLQKDIILYNSRELYMSNLYLKSKFDLYNEELKKIDKNSMSYFVLEDPDSFFDVSLSKDKVNELIKRNFFIPFIILDTLNEEVAMVCTDHFKLLKLKLIPKSFDEALFFVSILTNFSAFFKANEELVDLVDAFPDSIEELFDKKETYEDFIKVTDSYLKDKTFKYSNDFISDTSYETLKDKNLIINLGTSNFAISKDLKKLLDSLLEKVDSLKEISFKDYKKDIKDYCISFDSDDEDDDIEDEEEKEMIDPKFIA